MTDEAYELRKRFLASFPKQQDLYLPRPADRLRGGGGWLTASDRKRAPKFFVSLAFLPHSSKRWRSAGAAMWTPLFRFALEITEGGIEFGHASPVRSLSWTTRRRLGSLIAFGTVPSSTRSRIGYGAWYPAADRA